MIREGAAGEWSGHWISVGRDQNLPLSVGISPGTVTICVPVVTIFWSLA